MPAQHPILQCRCTLRHVCDHIGPTQATRVGPRAQQDHALNNSFSIPIPVSNKASQSLRPKKFHTCISYKLVVVVEIRADPCRQEGLTPRQGNKSLIHDTYRYNLTTCKIISLVLVCETTPESRNAKGSSKCYLDSYTDYFIKEQNKCLSRTFQLHFSADIFWG